MVQCILIGHWFKRKAHYAVPTDCSMDRGNVLTSLHPPRMFCTLPILFYQASEGGIFDVDTIF